MTALYDARVNIETRKKGDVVIVDFQGRLAVGVGDELPKRFGASLRLLKPQDRVRKTLRLTNLLPMFSVYETEADALKGFASEA